MNIHFDTKISWIHEFKFRSDQTLSDPQTALLFGLKTQAWDSQEPKIKRSKMIIFMIMNQNLRMICFINTFIFVYFKNILTVYWSRTYKKDILIYVYCISITFLWFDEDLMLLLIFMKYYFKRRKIVFLHRFNCTETNSNLVQK